MAISYEPELLLARDQGLKLVSIGALVQRPLTSIIALPGQHVDERRRPRGQARRHRRHRLPGGRAADGARSTPASTPAQRCSEVNVGFNLVPAMLSGQVDATLGGFWNYEAIQLRLLHKHPIVIPVDQAGVPTYDELVLVVREDEARTRRPGPARVPAGAHARRARGARRPGGRRGDADRRANPSLRTQAAARIDQADAARGAARATRASPSAGRSPPAWAAFGELDVRATSCSPTTPPPGLPPFTNEFLPGQGI